MAFRSGCVRARRRRAGRVDPSHRPWVRTDSAACQKRATRTTAEASRTPHNLFCIYYFRMRLCQVQTRASNALPRCRETNRRTPGTKARWRDGAMARWRDGRILRQSFGPVPFHEKMAEICGCERWFLRTWTKARILTWGYATRIGRPDRKRAQRPFTTANLCHFSVFGDTIFSSRMGIP